MLSRYRQRRGSAISLLANRAASTNIFTKIGYHKSRVATLEPMKDASETASAKDEEPIDDIGMPSVFTTVPQVKHKYHRDIKIQPLPPMVLESLDFDLLLKKLELCTTVCNFIDVEADKEAKAIKSATLRELNSIFCHAAVVQQIPPAILDAFFSMLKKNLFRAIPIVARKFLFLDDEPPLMDIAWPHLTLVYALLIGYQNVNPTDSRFDTAFLKGMMNLIRAPDNNEREQVLQWFNTYVRVFPDQIPSICISMSYVLILYREGELDCFGIRQILSFYLEHFPKAGKVRGMVNDIFLRAILPLISTQHVFAFYQPLTSLFDFYIGIDQTIVPKLLRRCFKKWPESKPSKQILYIEMINFLVSRMNLSDFEKMAKLIFKLYAKCALSCSAKIAEASFRVWQDVKIIPMIIDNTKQIFPVIYTSMNKTMKDHWNNKTQNLALNTLKSMHDTDPFVFDEVSQKKNQQNLVAAEMDAAMIANKAWALIARSAAKTDRSVNLAKVLADIQVKLAVAPPENTRSSTKKKPPSPVSPNRRASMVPISK